MQAKDGTCYLCNLLGTKQIGTLIEEHHVFGGANRRLSEHYGLKVYLCVAHHRIGDEAVHNNSDNMLLLREEGQRAFEEKHPDKNFREIFGRNYLPESPGKANVEESNTMFDNRPEWHNRMMERFTRRE